MHVQSHLSLASLERLERPGQAKRVPTVIWPDTFYGSHQLLCIWDRHEGNY